MSIGDTVKTWIFGVALRKGINSAAKLLVSYFAAKGVVFVGTFGGIVIDTGSEAALVIAINSVLTVVRNWIKVKFKISWL